MNATMGRTGLYRFIFVALLVLFNWPVLSIPGKDALPLWIFGVWACGIFFLWFASRVASASPGPNHAHRLGDVNAEAIPGTSSQAAPPQSGASQPGEGRHSGEADV